MQNDPIPLEELEELHYDNRAKATSIIRSTMAIVSILASSTLIWMLLRSKARLSTTQHRLLLGMSIMDILFSLGMSHFSAMAPRDDAYWTWNASGNQATCSAQGFLLIFGSGCAVMYCGSLNLYYLAVVKFKKSDRYITRKIEPFLHGFAIVPSLVIVAVLLVNRNVNHGGGGTCISAVYDPPHCAGREDGEVPEGFEIPCGRGRDGAVAFYYLSKLLFFFAGQLVIIASLVIIYRAVRVQEKRISVYGASSLGIGSTVRSGEAALDLDAERRSSWMDRLRRIPAVCSKSEGRQDRSNSRKVLNRAFAYTSAFYAAWLFYFIGIFFQIAGEEWPTSVWYLTVIFNPLQGLFNFLVFMYPRVTSAKARGGDDSNWFQAFAEAFWSRGGNCSRGSVSGGTRERGHIIPQG